MRREALAPLVLLALASVVPPPVHAQDTGFLYSVSLTPETGRVVLDRFEPFTVYFELRDLSRDSPAGLVPGTPDAIQQTQHQITVAATGPLQRGWRVQDDVQVFATHATSPPIRVGIGAAVAPQAESGYFHMQITATLRDNTSGHTTNTTAAVDIIAKPLLGIQALSSGGPIKLAPREIGQAQFRLINLGLFPKGVSFEVADNPCGLWVAPPSGLVLAPREDRIVRFSVQAPADQFWYQSMSCRMVILAAPDDNAAASTQTTLIATVDGFYVDITWVFNAVALALAIWLLVVLVRRRKEKLEEQILGKPQKPWTIPVESVYLRELKRRDPRAWYVVRHYLMEDEYKSALLWFHAYKKATRSDRKKERLILKQERKFERKKAKWAAKTAAPFVKADRYEANLQRKLDRKARKAFRKASAKQKKHSRVILAAHAKKQARAESKWESQAARAAKKGVTAPPRPVSDAPELPPAPVLESRRLADHRWSRRAARYRRRMVRRQGNLEVRFEKREARYLARLRRTVGRIGRKLEDPEFVAEHPLLQGARTAPAKAGAAGAAAKPAKPVKPAKASRAGP